MALKVLKGMVSGAVNELSSAVTGNKTAASREQVLAVKRDYISQPRLSELLAIVPGKPENNAGTEGLARQPDRR